jgi:hypothetical protein
VSLFRSSGAGRSEPDDPVVGYEEWRPAVRTRTLAVGTLACARCDAPVALAGARVTPSELLTCPFCLHEAPVRDFLSLGEPTRPQRVVVKVVSSLGLRVRPKPPDQRLPEEPVEDSA